MGFKTGLEFENYTIMISCIGIVKITTDTELILKSDCYMFIGLFRQGNSL